MLVCSFSHVDALMVPVCLCVTVCSLRAHPEVEDKEADQYPTEPSAAEDQRPSHSQTSDRDSG